MGIRVAVFDWHQAFLDSVYAFLKSHDDMDVMAVQTGGNGAVKLAQELKPDVIVLGVGISIKVNAEVIGVDSPGAKCQGIGFGHDDRRATHRPCRQHRGGGVCLRGPCCRPVGTGHPDRRKVR